MPFRLSEPRRPIEITLDGEPLVAEEGEPIAHALLANGALALARSPKFHRPRGPACLRAACDGCLMRVDGVPNVMTCLAPARANTEVASQNTLGSRKVDLLRVTDWFFPDGMNHHELFAGVPGVQGVMQAFARRVAGLGRLPDEKKGPRPARRRAVDVLVMGGGPAALAAASHLADAGREVEVLDDGLALGGSLLALRGSGFLAPVDAVARTLASKRNVRLRPQTVAAAAYPDGILVVGHDETELLEAKVLILAPGAHDGVFPFENNDLPGIFSARAGLRLLASGIAVGERVAIAVPPGGGPFGRVFQAEVARLGARVEVTLIEAAPLAASGTHAVKSVSFVADGKKKKVSVDALLVDGPRAPSFELCAQAGGELDHVAAGFVVRAPDGRVRRGVYAIGEVTGAPLDPTRILDDAAGLAHSVRADGV